MTYAVLFERFSLRHVLTAFLLRMTRRSVFSLEQGRLARAFRFLTQDVPERPEEPIESSDSTNRAFHAVDFVYDAVRASRPALDRLAEAWGSDVVHDALKKTLLGSVSRWLYLSSCADRLQSAVGEDRIRVIPQDPPSLVACDALGEADATFRRSAFKRRSVGAHWRAALRRAWWVLATFFAIIWVVVTGKRSASSNPPRNLGITVVSPSREFANRTRSYDFLVDDVRIRSDDVVFLPLVRLSARDRRRVEDDGYALAALDWRAPPAAWRDAIEVVRRGWLAATAKSPAWAGRTAFLMLRERWCWTGAYDRHPFRKLVSYADFGVKHMARNDILKRYGVETWYYLDSQNSTNTLTRPDAEPIRHPNWAFLRYDRCVCWNDDFVKYFQAHRQNISSYHAVGCLWSEHVRLLDAGKLERSPETMPAAAKVPGSFRIAVFDSTFRNDSYTAYSDGVAFARGIEFLLVQLPDIHVLFKEKKPRTLLRDAEDAGLLALYQRLETDPRCSFVGHAVSPADVIASVDLVVSFPFTSTAVEALGAGKPAVYFAPDPKFFGGYYDTIPGLVVGDADQLVKRIHEIRNQIESGLFPAYLDEHIRGPVDPFLDGKAISRFRELLTNSAQAERIEASEVS